MDDVSAKMAEMVQFLSAHRWIYDVHMTKFFSEKWWTNIPREWQKPLTELTVDELNQLPFGFTKVSWPPSLKQFILLSQRLSLPRSSHPRVKAEAIDISPKVKVGMVPKKAHEVSHLAGLVKRVCVSANCQVVLDVGSGLGYLGDCLCEQCGLCVVGLERETERLASARRREHAKTRDGSLAEGAGPDQSGGWSFHLGQLLPVDLKCPFHVSTQLNIDTSRDCIDKLSQLLLHLRGLQHLHGDLRVCVVGLHCCGDLSPSILSLFTDHALSDLTAIVLVSCCYHKTTQTPPTTPPPRWIPCSRVLSEILEAKPDVSINTFALRLAAQETRERWRSQTAIDHTHHERQVAYRGMLEAVSHGNDLTRKALRRLKFNSMADYAKTVATNLQDASVEQELLDYHAAHEEVIKFIEPFTALQVCLQGVLESLVMDDRRCLLTEKGVHSAEIVPTFEPSISPRNLALVATK